MIAVPADFAVTVPLDDTVATEVLLDDQVTSLLVAFEGLTVATSCEDSPSVNVIVVCESNTPVTEYTFSLTVTVHVAVLPWSEVLTVMIAVPTDFAVMVPSDDTAATEVLLDDQATSLLVAFDGLTVATSCEDSPSVNVIVV